MPNADDTAGRRILGVTCVAPDVLQMPQAFRSVRVTALYVTQAMAAGRLHALTGPPVLSVSPGKATGNALSGTRQGVAGSGILEKLRF